MTIPELKKKSLDELKVMAYDTLTQIQGLQETIKIINQTIAEKPVPNDKKSK